MNRATSAMCPECRSRTPLLALSLFLVLAGCTREPSGTEGPLAMPPAGNVRIISRSVPDKPGVLHRKWSLIGERNWSEASATDTTLRLDRSSPLNDPDKKSGCNIWECDLIIAPKSTDANTLAWTTRIHGSDGTTKEGQGEATVSNGIDAVRVELDRDSVLRLTAEPVLARIGDKTITLSVAK